MASYIKVPAGWRAMIRRKGYPSQSRTFDTKAQAERWARMVEREMDENKIVAGKQMTARELFEKYRDEVTPTKKGEKWETDRINKLLREEVWMDLWVEEVTGDVLRGYRDARLTKVSPGSVRREFALLGGVFGYAIKEGWIRLSANPCSIVRKPTDNKPRSQRVTDGELYRIIGDWREIQSPETSIDYLPFVATFAVETAMRLSEICSLRWESAFPKYVVCRDTKNGTDRSVPLSPTAREILDKVPKVTDYCFPVNVGTMGIRWREATERAGLGHIHFHDLRREATSRLSKKLPIEALAKTTGHLDLKVLMRVYYAPKPDELADLLS